MAVNDGMNGREKGVDLNLCDVCYWRDRAEKLKPLAKIGELAVAYKKVSDEYVYTNHTDPEKLDDLMVASYKLRGALFGAINAMEETDG